MARRHRKRKRSPEPEEVLAGRVDLKPPELIELIHRVNPTGRELDASQEADRYRQKAALQSLLIRRFGDEHLAVTPAEPEGVVSLDSHRGGTRDACHAVVDELDPDARAWVQRRLDLAVSSPAEAAEDDGPTARPQRPNPPQSQSAPGTAESPEQLLEIASAALEEYDYERAEHCLREAFDLSGGAFSTARPLLTFLAEQLGQDDAVLELEGRLEAEAAAHPDLRTILALAAARQGDAEGAARHVAGIDHPRLAEVDAALAATALGRGDAETAARHRDAVAARDPGHPQLAGLDRHLAQLHARGQQAAEEALERRYRAEGPRAVEEAARTLLGHWSESAVARRILREIAATHREEQIAVYLERGESALAEERFGEAARHFQAALDAGCEHEGLPERIARTLERARQSADDERVAAIVERLASAADSAAYLAYLNLSAELRRRARQETGDTRLVLLEQAMPESFSGAKAQALVAAVLAFERARAALRRDEPGTALDELAPHQHALRGLDEARQLEDEARVRLAAAKRKAAGATLRTAWDAFSAGDPEAARRTLDTLALTDLDTAERQRAETLRRQLDRAETAGRLEQEAAHHEAAGDLVGALERTRTLAEVAGDDEDARRRWLDRSTALEGHLRKAWRIEVTEDPVPLAEQHDVDANPIRGPELGAWLDDDGKELVLASCWGEELFVRLVDVESRTVRRQLSLRLPLSLEKPECVRDGDRLLLAAAPGVYLELGIEDGRILAWRSLDEIVPPGFRVDLAVPLPGGRYLWLLLDVPGRIGERTLVVDTKTFRIARTLEKVSMFTVLIGAETPSVLCSDATGRRLYSDRGALRTSEPVPGLHTGFAASGPPRGEALLSLLEGPTGAVAEDDVDVPDGTEEKGDDDAQGDGTEDGAQPQEDEVTSVALMRFEASPDGERMECSSALRLDGEPDGAHSIASDLTAEVTFALVEAMEQERELLAIDVSQPKLAPLYTALVPFETLLVQDRRSRHVVALARLGDSLELYPLGGEPPPWEDFPVYPPWEERRFPDASPPFHCAHPSVGETGYPLDRIQRLSDSQSEEFVQELLADELQAPEEPISVLAWLLRRGRCPEVVGQCIHELAGRHPDNAGAVLLKAEHEAVAGRWAETRRSLETIEPRDLEVVRRCHVWHLLGLSWLHEGKTENALATFRLGLDDIVEGGHCSILPLYHLARPMESPPRPEEWGPEEPFGRQLLGAVRTTDATLQAGDLEAARQVIDRPVVWQEEELQSAARLASVYLDTPAAKPGERFRKRLALAFFRHVWRQDETLLRHELPLPDVRWDAPRLEDLARRSSRWLDGET